MFFEDTICAPATSVGNGAINIIRLSGRNCFEILDKVVRFKKGTTADFKGYTVHFGTVLSRENEGEVLDEVLVTVFRAPYSYTGEDSAEISCHASPYITSNIIYRLIDVGARSAEAGEFTKRAFINGKMDLAQAEAVADVIASETASAHRVSMNQLKGGYSKELAGMRDELLELTSLMELELDFSEEEVEFANRSRLKELLGKITGHINGLTDSFRVGNAVKNGVPVAIAGATNAGKSTLLNSLLNEERAIVSDIPGTTRDTIEESMILGGYRFRFIDTAGIRESDETIEKIGIQRTFEEVRKADIILYVIDSSEPIEEEVGNYLEFRDKVDFKEQKLILLFNKCDKDGSDANALAFRRKLEDVVRLEGESLRCNGEDAISISAKTVSVGYEEGEKCGFAISSDVTDAISISAMTGEGVEDIKKRLIEIQSGREAGSYGTLVTNARHFEALTKSGDLLRKVGESLDAGIPNDLIAQDLREALHHLGTITGSITTDEVLGRIFEKFCIGK